MPFNFGSELTVQRRAAQQRQQLEEELGRREVAVRSLEAERDGGRAALDESSQRVETLQRQLEELEARCRVNDAEVIYRLLVPSH